MYWQVYLHKTVVAAEFMLIHVLRRAKELAANNKSVFGSPALLYFLRNEVTIDDFRSSEEVLQNFAQLDDYDILGAIKVWQSSEDKVLSDLSRRIIDRKLFKIEVSRKPYDSAIINSHREEVVKRLGITTSEANHYVFTERLINSAYNDTIQNINLLMKDGSTMDVADASDNLNISALSNPVEKYFLCYPVFD